MLGSPRAPVTITEYGDLVCPICAEFANTTERPIIAALVRSGRAKFVHRSFETASSYANGAQWVNMNVAARSAGLQGREWSYVLLMFREQPRTIRGRPAELAPYIDSAYLRAIAAQIRGLDLARWQSHLADRSLIRDVGADEAAANRAGAVATPTVYVSGRKGTVAAQGAIPTLASIESLVGRVG